MDNKNREKLEILHAIAEYLIETLQESELEERSRVPKEEMTLTAFLVRMAEEGE
jgi:hypothetical protein